MAREQKTAPVPRRLRFRWYLFWGVMLVPWFILGYEVLRLTPIYFNYVKVSRGLEQAAADFQDGDDPESLARGVAAHFQKEGVLYPQVKDIGVSRDGSQWLLEARYDDQAPLLFNVAVVVSFDKMVRAPKVAGVAGR
jgi:hypothetical protein